MSQATLSVAVRARPVSKKERLNGARTITKTVDDKCMVVMDPDDPSSGTEGIPGRHVVKGVHSQKKHVVAGGVRKRERRYVFDGAFDGETNNEQVYLGTAGPLVRGVLRGVNATVFAYGATGSGKTHTMVGNESDPGLMVLSLRDVFRGIADEKLTGTKEFKVECSYTEVYNELVYDLLVPLSNSKPLELREDPERGPMVSGLTHVSVTDEREIFALLKEGNARRKTEETGANSTSSRSHAVLEIWVTRSEKNHYDKAYTTAKLTLVDLAGAERASETNNRGQQLRDGANINKSLLSLANCINALGKRKKKGFVFVPFRDSKLTRILKDGLCGNSKTVMVATVSGSSEQYEHTVNTLKYADRAKEIKTFVQENRGTVETHIAEYQRMIDALREERVELKAEVERLKGDGEGGDLSGGLKGDTSGTKPKSTEKPKPTSPDNKVHTNPIAQVNELLLAAAAALPEGDVLRVEAEALAARARRAASMGYGNESCSPGKDGTNENEVSGDVLDGLQYATRVLHETIRLGRVGEESESSRSEGSEGDDSSSACDSSSPRSTSSNETFDSVLDKVERDAVSVSNRADESTRVNTPTKELPQTRGALSPVPENVARGRAEAAKVVQLAKQKGEKTSMTKYPYKEKHSRAAFNVWESRSVSEKVPSKKKASRVVSGLIDPGLEKEKRAVKPSPYAQISSRSGVTNSGKPRSAALQRRLSKIQRG